ncbi:unnamed protein product [Boreogadus saida]
MQRKLKNFVKKFDNFRFYVRPLCELQLFAALDAYDIRHHTRTWNSAVGTEMAISLLHFTTFFQGEDKSQRFRVFTSDGNRKKEQPCLLEWVHSGTKHTGILI